MNISCVCGCVCVCPAAFDIKPAVSKYKPNYRLIGLRRPTTN